MKGFFIKTLNEKTIRFKLYVDEAPQTSEAFLKSLPFSKKFFHARVSGQEIWIDEAPELDIIQENSSVFTEPGEIVLGPLKPTRTKTSKCLGIYYGEGKGFDCCNIFGKVFDEDLPLLKSLGDAIWRQGALELTFEVLD
ncbi:MAG: DUF3830 family protein [Chitinophagaceae bacterium]